MRQLAALVLSTTFFSLASCGPDFSGVIREWVQAFYIPSSSSAPNLLRGDRILVDKRAYRDSPPARGDLIVLRISDDFKPRDRNPNAGEKSYLSRVVGVPGDRIRIEKGDVYINGEAQSLSPIGGPANLEGQTAQVYQVTGPGYSYKIARLTKHNSPSFDEITVEPNRYFVLGDSLRQPVLGNRSPR